MEISDPQLAAAFRLAMAGLIGLAVGLEREWSGHAVGPQARFAGLRTFLLLGLVGGTAGLLASDGHELVGAAVAGGGAALTVAAYVMFLRQSADRDGTTEAAAILVVGLGALAGIGSWLLAVGAASVMVLALSEKKRLHAAVSHVRQEELTAALQFSVLALVVLPLLPEGPFLGWAAIRPRSLWMIVLLFCALNFAAFVARRNASENRGYLITGFFGGVISSTAVTLGFARYSRRQPDAAAALGGGVVAASTVLVPRVLLTSFIINQSVGLALLPYVVPAGLIGAAIVALAWRFGKRWEAADSVKDVSPPGLDTKNPLRLGAAIRLAVILQLAIVAIKWIRATGSAGGLYAGAALLGLTDTDALTVSLSTPSTDILPSIAARAIAIGILSNTLVKLGISVVVGAGRYRLIAAGVLLLMAAAIGGALVYL